jgi:hypothetical protein
VTQPTPPLLGYNNNVRYQGRTFHIQTEDSGTQYARIVTHLFVDGGQIVKSIRSQYSELLGKADRAELVRKMMKDQHKAMFISLRAGEFDAAITRIVGKTEGKPLPSMPSSVDIEPQSVRLGEGTTLSGIPTEAIQALPSTALSSPPSSSNPEELRSAGNSKRSRSSVPASPRRPRVVDDPTPVEYLPPVVPKGSGRPSERLIRATQGVSGEQPPDALDPRNRSIFGDAADGKQTLDEVILSFLEEEES